MELEGGELGRNKLVKGVLMNGFHCEQLGFNLAEDPLRGCRTFFRVFSLSNGKARIFTHQLPCSLVKGCSCGCSMSVMWAEQTPAILEEVSPTEMQKDESTGGVEVSLERNYPPQMQANSETSCTNKEFCSINHTLPKESLLIFPFSSPTSIYEAFRKVQGLNSTVSATDIAFSIPYHSSRR